MNGRDPQLYLRAADEMLGGDGLTGPAAVAGGWWPKACACLIRLGLEAGIDAFWDARMPEIAACRARRIQLIMLRRYAGADVARRASYTWVALSRMTHYQCHDPMPTADELRRLHTTVLSLLAVLAHH